MTITTITNPDIDYLENVKYLDLIISKKTYVLGRRYG